MTRISRLSFFGAFLKGPSGSDIDFLVDFEPEVRPGPRCFIGTAALAWTVATRRRTKESGAMERAVTVKGRVTDSRHIELDEPVENIAGEVEVTVRPLGRTQEGDATDIETLVRLVDEWRAKHPDQLRSKEDIDRYLAEERVSWGDDER